MINDVKLIYITCGFLRLICSVLLTVCSHFKVNLSIGQFISFQKEQRLLPVFPLLNATVRIIEPLATTFRKELLSGRSEVRILLATPRRRGLCIVRGDFFKQLSVRTLRTFGRIAGFLQTYVSLAISCRRFWHYLYKPEQVKLVLVFIFKNISCLFCRGRGFFPVKDYLPLVCQA